jgi:GT2 family glycosyltransferase
MTDDPNGIVSGQVLPEAGGDPRTVPSTIMLEQPRDYTGELSCSGLYGGNMACPRDAVLALGGFDESLVSAEDCDFCYRWLRRGRRLRHDPQMVVTHRDWRAPEELEQLYVRYYVGQGMFYAKHLRAGDPRVLRFLARDLGAGLRAAVAGRLYGVPRWADERRAAFRGLPRGLTAGLLR